MTRNYFCKRPVFHVWPEVPVKFLLLLSTSYRQTLYLLAGIIQTAQTFNHLKTTKILGHFETIGLDDIFASLLPPAGLSETHLFACETFLKYQNV